MKNLVTKLKKANKFTSLLFNSVEQQLNLLSMGVAPASQTARAFNRAATWGTIAEAARADSEIYGDPIYDEIAKLATAAENAWSRCSSNIEPARQTKQSFFRLASA